MNNEDMAPLPVGLRRYLFSSLFSLFLFACMGASGQSLDSTDYPMVWLRADSSGSMAGFWKNVSGKAPDASLFGQPLQNRSFNYNPAFWFNGMGDSVSIPCNVDSLAAITIIAVFQPADTVETGVWSSVNASAHKMMMTTRRVTGPGGRIDSIGSSGKFAMLSTVIQNWRPGSIVNPYAYLLFGAADQQNGIPSFKGTIAELLVFNRSLDVLTQIQYETYLAIKYGIPLTRGNYVSAGQTVLWNAEKNKDFAYRMTGLGRDNFFSLHQKQAVSAIDTDSLLVISHGKFMPANAANTGTIPNGNYLVWGDNNKTLATSITTDGQLRMVNRQWLMNASGEAVNELQTTVRLNQKALNTGRYWLVVNPGAYAGFPVDSLNYYFPDSVTAGGLSIYSNVQWDADHSGSDLFGFAVAKDLLLKLKVLDSAGCSSETGKARLQAIGGQPPFTYTVTNNSGGIVAKGTFLNGAPTVDVSNLSVGTYRVLLKDSKGHQSLRMLSMAVPAAQRLNIGLEANMPLPATGDIVLDASRNIAAGDALRYQWTCENGFNATSPQITVRQPGAYVVNVTSRNGCVFSDTVNITGKARQNIAVYPSPSTDGNFTISMSFPRATDVKVGIYDVKGNKVQEMTGKNNTEFRFAGHIATSGAYTITVVSKQGVDSRTLLIL
jgi:hypothetical protein